MIVKSLAKVLVALAVFGLYVGGARTAKAQGIPDGFSGNGVVWVTGFDILLGGNSVLSPGVTSTGVPGGTYTLTMTNDAKFWLAGEWTGDPNVGGHPIDIVWGFFEVFTVEPTTAPSLATNTGWGTDTFAKGTNGAYYGWRDPDKTYGLYPPSDPTHQNKGQMYAAGDTSVVGTFTLGDATFGSPQGNVYFGLEVSTTSGVFGSGNTGKVYFWTNPGDGFVPEPAFYQMAGFLSLGGLGLLKLRRRRR